jgi:putative FmdB family regulatory protein
MPTYDYICNKCGHTFELFQSMTETPRKTCPVCKRVVRRLVSGGSGLIFKGSGFYLTDYKNVKKPSKDKKETKKKEPSKTVKKAKD